MQMKLYDAWEVRVPFGDDETFKQAMNRVLNHAQGMGIDLRFRRGKGMKNYTPRFHFWEVSEFSDAFALYLAFGDVIKAQKYPLIENT